MNEVQKSKFPLTDHPMFLVGFRPFFILAIISGIILPLLWVLMFSGKLPVSLKGINILQWHVHEMFFGFGWAILGGFLLTASKNWVKIRGMHGGWLGLAAAMWLLERVGVWFYGYLPSWLNILVINAFILYVSAYVIRSLVVYRKNDSFKDNYFFVIVLLLFIISKNLIFTSSYYTHGWLMALGLFRMAFVLMFERTLTQFMKNTFGVSLLRNPILDYSIKVLVLASAFVGFFPNNVSAIILCLAGLLLAVRFLLWHPIKGFSNFGIGMSYLGLLGLTVHFFLEALRMKQELPVVGALSVHVFTFICMGVVIPAMIIRIAQGHTGRKLLFTRLDRIALSSMIVGAFFRLIMPQIQPQAYMTWLALAGIGWSLCFALIGYRLIPFMLQPRIDGKEH